MVLQPTNQSVPQGSTASFTATASGTPSPTVQWQVSTNGGANWSAIAGATADSYSVDAVTTGYEYEAVFTNSVSSVTSLSVQLIALFPSSNWAGYALTNSTFSAVSGSWTVPSVSCPLSGDFYASQWVGIDGISDSYVMQDGTSTDCDSGFPVYSAWYEFFGDSTVHGGFAVPLPSNTYPVAPGNVMSANVIFAAGVWTFTLTNSTDSWTFSTTVPEPSPPPLQASAEWIVEAPEICNPTCIESSVADFGSVTFTGASATANGSTTSLISSSGEADVVLNAESEVLTSPGPLSDQGSSFTVTWHQSS
jgi:hypothetical protein